MFRGPPYAVPAPPVIRWTLVEAEEPLALDLDEVKIFINRPVEDTTWDDEIKSFVLVAQRALENYCQIKFTASTWRGTLPAFYDSLNLILRPFLDVTALEYVDATTGTITTVPSDVYHVLPIAQNCGMIYLGDSESWPAAARRQDAVRLTARAGFAVTAEQATDGFPELPYELKHALLMMVAALDMSRGDAQSAGTSNVTVYAMRQSRGAGVIPPEVASLVAPWKYRQVIAA